MSVHVLYDQFKRKSVMFCSTDGMAFGPVFDGEDAIEFCEWCADHHMDPRDMSVLTLLAHVARWQDETATVTS